jgi:hypothetical protein
MFQLFWAVKCHNCKPPSLSFSLKQTWLSFYNAIRCANIDSLLWYHELGALRTNYEGWENDCVLLKVLDWRCNLKIGRMTMCIKGCQDDHAQWNLQEFLWSLHLNVPKWLHALIFFPLVGILCITLNIQWFFISWIFWFICIFP